MRKEEITEILVWIVCLGLVGALMISLHLTLADQNKVIQRVHREIETLNQKIQTLTPRNFSHAIKAAL